MVSVCLPSDALSQHLQSNLYFSYLGHWVSLHGCSSKVQLLLLTFDEGYLLMATPPDLESGVAPLGPPVPAQLLLLGESLSALPEAADGRKGPLLVPKLRFLMESSRRKEVHSGLLRWSP